MKVEEIRILVHEYTSAGELPEDSRDLVEQAREASRRAYAPYSQFRVGAAVQLENGEIITGNNQENSAYPSGLCAERVALFYAGSRFPGVAVVKMAIAAFHKEKYLTHPVYPCGDCRQVMLEYELRGKQPIQVILYGSEKIQVVKSTKDLLPLPFIDDFGL
ncbi:MAG: cytidine deaminase [Bacteroidota bacterium]